MPGLAGNDVVSVDRDDLSDELPSSRAEVLAVSEHAGIHVRASAGPVKGELDVSSVGTGRSYAAIAVAFLIVAATAGLSGVALSAICWFAHVPSPVVAAVGLAGFIGVLVTGVILAFRKVRQPDPRPPGTAQNATEIAAPVPAGRHRSGMSREGRPPDRALFNTQALAALAGSEREYISDRTLEGLHSTTATAA
jgi:hypothetical protein